MATIDQLIARLVGRRRRRPPLVDATGRPNRDLANLSLREQPLVNLNLKFFGYEMARRLAAELPERGDTAARHVGLSCKPSTQVDMESDWVAHWCRELKVPVIFHRKLWELAYVLQALHDNALIEPGRRGLVFGAGEEPLPSYLAARGVGVTVTDLAVEEAAARGWTATGQHATARGKAYREHLVERADFDRLVDSGSPT